MGEQDSQESCEKHDRCSLGEESDGDGEEHDTEILPVEPLSQTHNTSPGEEEKCRDEKRVVIYIGHVHGELRLEGDERREERTDKGIEPERSGDEESEKHGDCSEEDGEDSNGIESDENILFRERRLESARDRMIKTL